MENYELAIDSANAKKRYQVCEIEFYLDDGDKHSDSFAHKDPIQLQSGKWYLHRLVPKKRDSFK